METEINSIYLEAKWASIDARDVSAYRFQRISSESRTEINIGLNERGDRCLILELPKGTEMVFFNRRRQNLSMFHIPDQGYIVIELLDAFFNDVFTDLIVSLYHRIKGIYEVDSCARELASAYAKWSEFFSAQDSRLLSESALKGLWGELFVLKGFLASVKPIEVDRILESWRGPYDTSHDFVFSERNIEVKTRDAGQPDVRISSEYQLEPEFEKPLELLVLNLVEDQLNGVSISVLVEDIRQILRETLGDSEILLRGLAQKGLHMRNLSDYPRRFTAVNSTVYDCTAEDFPRLHRSALNPALQQVKYNIRTTGLDRFILNQTSY